MRGVVRSVLADFGLIGTDAIDDGATLDELALDSLDVVELALILEDQLSTEIPDGEIDGWRTVGDVVASAEAHK